MFRAETKSDAPGTTGMPDYAAPTRQDHPQPGGAAARSAAHGVHAAVYVHDLARGGREPVRQQRRAAASGGLGIAEIPAERGAPLPQPLEVLEARDAPGRH